MVFVVGYYFSSLTLLGTFENKPRLAVIGKWPEVAAFSGVLLTTLGPLQEVLCNKLMMKINVWATPTERITLLSCMNWECFIRFLQPTVL